VPQTTKIFSRTCPARSRKILGSILNATFPANVTPCLPESLHAVLMIFAAHMAIILRIFILYQAIICPVPPSSVPQ